MGDFPLGTVNSGRLSVYFVRIGGAMRGQMRGFSVTRNWDSLTLVPDPSGRQPDEHSRWSVEWIRYLAPGVCMVELVEELAPEIIELDHFTTFTGQDGVRLQVCRGDRTFMVDRDIKHGAAQMPELTNLKESFAARVLWERFLKNRMIIVGVRLEERFSTPNCAERTKWLAKKRAARAIAAAEADRPSDPGILSS